MLRIIPIFFLFLTFIEKSFVQTVSSNEDFSIRCENMDSCGIVIAMSGLKLRATPDINGKVLVVMPLGSKLQRLKPEEAFLEECRTMTQDSIWGVWEKVEYKGMKGFAFNAYFGEGLRRMKDDYYLVCPQAGWCWSDAYISPQYHYYGLFTNRDSSQWHIKKVKPVVYAQQSDLPGTSIKADGIKQPVFILVSKKQLSETNITSKKTDKILAEWKWDNDTTIMKSYDLTIPYSSFRLRMVPKPNNNANDNWFSVQLTDTSTGKHQILVDMYGNQAHLSWVGDLDQDGKMDFMIRFSGDHGLGFFLFLTGNATKSQIVKPIVPYWFGDCC